MGQHVGNAIRVSNTNGMLGGRARHRNLIDATLQDVEAFFAQRRRASHEQHRCAVMQRIHHRGHGIGKPRPGSNHADTQIAGHPRPCLRRVACAGFMSGIDQVDPIVEKPFEGSIQMADMSANVLLTPADFSAARIDSTMAISKSRRIG